MIILLCPECLLSNIVKNYELENESDDTWFTCNDCEETFTLASAEFEES